MRLYEHAKIMRSKNAGPFTLTIDLIFENEHQLRTVLASPSFNERVIAELYSVSPDSVKINILKPACAIKISLPRSFGSSGAPGDRDVYGCQQHFPLADLQIQN